MTAFTHDQLDYFARRHIKYEIETTAYITSTWWTAGQALRRRLCVALIEAGLIHLRLLDSFLWPKRKQWEDDVQAVDYVPEWQASMGSPLDRQRKDVNKQLAHLSMMRRRERPVWNLNRLTIGTFEAFEDFLTEVDSKASRFASSFAEAKEITSRFLSWIYDYDDAIAEPTTYQHGDGSGIYALTPTSDSTSVVIATDDPDNREPLRFPAAPTYQS